MSEPIIRVVRLGKQYQLGAPRQRYRTVRETVQDWATSWVRRPAATMRSITGPVSFWALDDVSFDVHPGEAVAIIGRNGAGKSTLLKVLSRITAPTRGQIELRGRLASLLEVGTGFHPELSGRENIFLNGAILGMTRHEIRGQFDDIVAFAEVDRFIDTQVKHYSSGMYMRLAFAVAAHLQPEILVVDEVLAVGDVTFQKKCLGKMNDVARQGRTVLFVSHNMTAVVELCTRAVLLDAGRIALDGSAQEVVSTYLATGLAETRSIEFPEPAGAPHPAEVVIRRGSVEPAVGDITNGQPVRLRFEVEIVQPGLYHFFMHVLREGVLAFVSADFHRPADTTSCVAGDRFEVTFEIPPYLLNPGLHTFGLAAMDGDRHVAIVYDQLPCLVHDDRQRRGGVYAAGWGGAVAPLLAVSGRRLNETTGSPARAAIVAGALSEDD